MRLLAGEAEESGYAAQYEMLQDGVVTEAEYRRAYVDATECMEQGGMEVQYFEIVPTEYGSAAEGIFAPGTLSDGEASEVSNRCEVEYDSLVSQAWSLQQGDEFTAGAAELMTECLSREYDVDATGATTFEDFMASGGGLDPASACLGETRLRLREAAGVEEPVLE